MKRTRISSKDVQKTVLAHLKNLAQEGVYVGMAENVLEKYDNEAFHVAFSKEVTEVIKTYKKRLEAK